MPTFILLVEDNTESTANCHTRGFDFMGSEAPELHVRNGGVGLNGILNEWTHQGREPDMAV